MTGNPRGDEEGAAPQTALQLVLEGAQSQRLGLRQGGTGRLGQGTTQASAQDASDQGEGGVLCRACAGPGAPVVPAAGLALVGRILGGGLRGVLVEPPGPALNEAESLALRALEHHLERRLRSTPMLLATIPGHAPRS